ncbi:MAG: biopolymer transporter ExbD [Elusimicrobiota bacterium]|jgi:biopolymer transport protein ExbD
MAGSTYSNSGPITGINITPLVDVCLVLVIIFMVATPLMMQPNLPVELPKARTAEGEETDNVTLTITADGQWALNETPMTLEALPAALRSKVEQSRDGYVIVRADRRVPYGWAQNGLRMAREAGARILALATEQKSRQEVGRGK